MRFFSLNLTNNVEFNIVSEPRLIKQKRLNWKQVRESIYIYAYDHIFLRILNLIIIFEYNVLAHCLFKANIILRN